MPELPVISGDECMRALGNLGYEVLRSKGTTFALFVLAGHRSLCLVTISWTVAPSGRSFARPN